MVSNGVVHDSSPPESAIAQIVAAPTVDADLTAEVPLAFYQTDKLNIHAAWAAFEDPHTLITDLRVGLGTAEFGTDVHELAPVNITATAISFAPKSGTTEFLTGQAYYVVFRAENQAKAVNFTRTAPLYIDVTPPTVDYIVDVFPYDVDGVSTHWDVDDGSGDVDVTDGRAVRAKFHCVDPDSVEEGVRGVMNYEWRICDAADCAGTIYQDWLSVGTAKRSATNGTELADAVSAGTLSWVFVQVRCTNPAGLSTTFSSNGVQLDMRPPITSNAVVADFDPVPGTGRDPRLSDVDWLGTTSLLAGWTGFETADRPPIVLFRVAVGTAPGLDDIITTRSVALESQAALPPPVGSPLPEHVRLYVTVTAVSLAGATANVSSDGVVLDYVHPTPTLHDAEPYQYSLTDPRRCAAHLKCMSIAAPGSDVDAVPTALSLSLAVTARTGVAPLTLLRYGASSCEPAHLLDLNVLQLSVAASVDDRNITTDGLFMAHAQRVCSVVFMTSTTGEVGYAATNGVVVDLSPPVPLLVHEGASLFTDDDAVASLRELNVSFSCGDVESGIHHVEARVSRVSYATGQVLGVVVPWRVVPASASQSVGGAGSESAMTTRLTGISLIQGEWYVTSIRCVNRAGAYEDLDSDGFVADVTAPDAGQARIQHSVHDLSVHIQPHRGLVSASWRGFADPESPVTGFSWSIGTSPGGTDVLAVSDVGPKTHAEATGVRLRDGETYYVTVYATTDARLVSSATSTGVTVDGSAPGPVVSLHVATDLEHGQVGWIARTTNLTLSWQGVVEPHTAVAYQWAFGTVPQGQQVVQWVDVGNTTSVDISSLALLPGVTYYASVRATNLANLTSESVAAFGVDPFPPSPGRVFDGVSRFNDRRYRTDVGTVACSWDEFADAVSGIAKYRVGVGLVEGTAGVVAFRDVPASAASVTFTEVTIAEGVRHHCTVVAFDHAGNSMSVSSLGVVADSSPAVPAGVLDLDPSVLPQGSVLAAFQDVDYVASTTVVAAGWPGWSDDESGIARVEWAIGTTPAGQDLLPWTHVRAHRTWGQVDLAAVGTIGLAPPGTTVYTSVRMYNGAGLPTVSISDGFTLVSPAGTGSHLPVSATALYIAATPDAAEPASWCACGDIDGNMAASGAVYDPVTGACSCGPSTYLDPATRLCTACPAGTCKSRLGNSIEWCTAAACSETPVTAATPPPNAASLTTCGPAGQGRVIHPDHGSCTCPAGTRMDFATNACISCEAGTVNPFIVDSTSCRSCWEAPIPDVVLQVDWDTSHLTGDDRPVTGFVVSVGTSPGATRWVRTIADPSVSSLQFTSRAPSTAVGTTGPPMHHGSLLYVRVRALAGDVVVSDGRVSTAVDLSPPVPGLVYDGDGVEDADVVGWGASLFASFFDFRDSTGTQNVNASMLAYRVSFGTSPYGSDLVALTEVDVAAELLHDDSAAPVVALAVPGVPPSDGTVVFATVLATDAAGGWSRATSDGAVVQSVVPEGLVALVLAADAPNVGGSSSMQHATVISDTVTIGVAWRFDTGIAALEYEWELWEADEAGSLLSLLAGPVPAGQRTFGVATYFTNATATSVTVPWETILKDELLPGAAYAARVTARNAAGVARTSVSPIARVDLSPPSTATVVAHRGAPPTQPAFLAENMMFQATPGALQVEWSCSDDESLITSAVIGVGSVVGGEQGKVIERVAVVNANTTHPVVRTTTLSGLDLDHGQCYVIQVACANDAFQGEFGVSNEVCVDSSGPLAAVSVMHPLLSASLGPSSANSSQPAVASASDAETQKAIVRVLSSAAHNATSGQPSASLRHIEVATPHLATAARMAAADQALLVMPAQLNATITAHLAVGDTTSGVTRVVIVWSTVGATVDTAAVDAGAVVPPYEVPLQLVGVLGEAAVGAGVSYADLAEALLSAGLSLSTTPLFMHLRVTNGGGEVTSATADAVLVLDDSPAWGTVSAVDAGPVLYLDAGVPLVAQWQTTMLRMSWTFKEPDTPLIGYVWSASSPTGSDAVSPAWTGGDVSAMATGLALAHGNVYTVTVTACTSVACTSQRLRVLVDTSPPVASAVYIGPIDSTLEAVLCGTDACTAPAPVVVRDVAALSQLGTISWGEFVDVESGIAGYEVCIGSSPRGTQLGMVHHVGLSRSIDSGTLVAALSPAQQSVMFNSGSVYVSVTGVNGAGVSATTAVALMVVDELAPSAGMVSFVGYTSAPARVAVLGNDGLPQPASYGGGVGLPHTVQTSTSSARVRWRRFASHSDVNQTLQTNAAEYTVTLVTTQAGEIVSPSIVVADSQNSGSGTWLEASFAGLSLIPGTQYSALVSARDVAGNEVTAHSAVPLVVDTTPPVLGRLRDGLDRERDADCLPRTGVDPVSVDTQHLATFMAQIGGRGVQVARWADVESNEGSSSIAADPANSTSSLYTPTRAKVTVVSFNFDLIHDDVSGVSVASVSLGYQPGSDEVMAWTALPSTAAISAVQVVLTPALAEGAVVYASLRAVNAAGFVTERSTDGLRILCTPGSFGCDYDGNFICLT